MSRKSSSLWWFVLGALAIGAGAWYLYGRRPPEDPARLYRTVAVDRGEVTAAVSANGTLNPVTLVNVGTQVSGTVRAIHADFNDHVVRDQVLLELDQSLFAAQARQSEANLANARAALDLAAANEARARALFEQEYISRQDLDQARQAWRSAQAQVRLAQAQHDRDRVNLGYTVIRSPVSGVVVSREIDVGQTVAASFQTPVLFKIAQDLVRMQINTSFAEADVGQIRVGQKATFAVDAYPNRSFAGVVKQIRLNPTVLQNVVTYDVVISVENPEQILLPGMTAYVNVVLDQRADALRVPDAALRFRPEADPDRPAPKPAGGPQVYVLREGALAAVPVTLGIGDKRFTEVRAGLRAGDRVVVGNAAEDGDARRRVRVRVF
ncbi:MAG: efflux RND transporter periplasmic adaptor subunit [Gammaproteobacteria bacterium]